MLQLARCFILILTLWAWGLAMAMAEPADDHSGSGIWSPMDSRCRDNLNGVWAHAPNFAIAVGDNGRILQYDGTSWTSMASNTGHHLYGVWGSAMDNIFAVGQNGAIWRYNGTSWTAMSSPTTNTLYGVWGTSAKNLYVVGTQGTILRYNGTDWSSMVSGTLSTLKGIWGSSDRELFAVGAQGTIVHYNGTAWALMPNVVAKELQSVGGNGIDDVFIAGSDSTVIHYDGSAWTVLNTGADHGVLYGVWGVGANQAIVAGRNFLYYNGKDKKWSHMGSPGLSSGGISGTQAGDVLVVGSQGQIFHYNAARPHTVSTPASPNGLNATTIHDSETYTVAYATCSHDHPIAYQFDWGDETLSGWQSAATATHIYHSSGTKVIKVQARCASNPALTSEWSADKPVIVYATHTVNQPTVLTGPARCFVAQQLTYTADVTTCNQGHPLESHWDWGDGNGSDWNLNPAAGYSYNNPDGYSVRVQGRCSVRTHIVSQWSTIKSVTVAAHTVATPKIPCGMSDADVGDDLVYTTGGAECIHGHQLEYSFDWGDNTWSAWSAVASLSHAYTQAGTYHIKAQARCGQYLCISSNLSNAHSVLIRSHQLHKPELPSGTNRANPGEAVTCTSHPLVCEQGHLAQYRFDWGDGEVSGWLATPTANHSYNNLGVYQIQVQARCSVKHTVLSPGSESKSLRVNGAAYDFDGDGKADLTIWAKASGKWQLLQSSTDHTTFISRLWGANGANDWLLVPADYDGDSKCDLAVWKKSTGEWYCLKSSDSNSYLYKRWGNTGTSDWIPVPGDYDGDAKADFAIWHNQTGEWYILKSSDNNKAYIYRQWGSGGIADWLPVPGDYDGDGQQDIAVWEKNTGEWYILKSSDHYSSYLYRHWGDTGMRDWHPVPGDYDGDAKTDMAIWNKNSGEWHCLKSSDNYNSFLYRRWKEPGLVDWVPVPADYDGDAKTDMAIWNKNSGEWYCLKSSDNESSCLYKVWASGGSNTWSPIMQLHQWYQPVNPNLANRDNHGNNGNVIPGKPEQTRAPANANLPGTLTPDVGPEVIPGSLGDERSSPIIFK